MKNLLYLFIPLLFFSCMNVESKVDADNNKVVIVEFGDLTSLSDDKQYGNFEIKVPEIDNNVMQNGAVLAYIERAATDVRPQRWSQFPQSKKGLKSSSAIVLRLPLDLKSMVQSLLTI